MAKDQKRVEGASSKKASQAAQKASETERSLKQTMDVWDTEAPFAFEAYQRIDEQRLNLMKEVITKFETARSDAAQRLMASTEQSMQVVLSFDPQTDMQEFALRNGSARGGSTSSFVAPGAPATPTTRLNRKNSVAAGTYLGRSSTPAQTNGVNEFGGVGQSSSASVHSTDRSGTVQGTSEQGTPSRSTGGGSTLKSALTRFGRGRSNRNANDTQTIYGTLPEGPEAAPMKPPSVKRAEPGERRSFDSYSDVGGRFAPSSAAAGGAGAGAVAGSLMAPLAPSRYGSGSTPAAQQSAPRVDAEGFSIPPPDRKPWEMGDTQASPSLMDDEERETMTELGQAKMTGMSIAQKPIAEDAEQDQAALERMRSTLLTARSPAAGPQRRNTGRRDRRDVRNTTYNPSLNLDDGGLNRASTFGVGQADSPIAPQSAFTGTPGTGAERSQSIVSSGSMSQMGNVSLDANSLSPGLHATITERVNVLFSGHEISKMMVVGEVTVSVRELAAKGPVHLRIEAFEQLEKAAPNPAYLKPVGGNTEKAGEYLMDVGAILSQGGRKATLLKYQLHVSPNRWKEYAPLNVTAQWRCEERQTSILVNYSTNSEAKTSLASSTAAIQDVSLSVDVTSPTVSNMMSKPSAVYSSEQKKLFWRLTEPVTNTPNKVLARFHVDQASQVCPIEVRWRLPGLTLSALDLSIVDPQSGVAFGQINRQTMSGKYMASP